MICESVEAKRKFVKKQKKTVSSITNFMYICIRTCEVNDFSIDVLTVKEKNYFLKGRILESPKIIAKKAGQMLVVNTK